MWKISRSFEARVLAFLDSLGFSKLSVNLDKMKFEIPISQCSKQVWRRRLRYFLF